MERLDARPARSARRLIVFEMLGACLVILVLAQAFIGLLGLAAFNRLATNATIERVELLARNTAAQIENGLRMGKPLAQYTGLARLLENTAQGQQDLLRIGTLLPDGHVLEVLGDPASPHDGLVRAVVEPASAPTGLKWLADGGATLALPERIGVAVPLRLRDGSVAGVLELWVDDAAQRERERDFLRHSAGVLALTTAGAALLLVLVLVLAPPGEGAGTRRLALPLAAMLLAQGLYALDATTSFRSAWLESSRDNVVLLAERTQRDLARVFGMGVSFERVRGVDALFQRLAASLPTIGEVILRDNQGKVLGAADAHGSLPRAMLAPHAPAAGDDMRMVLPLTVLVDGATQRVGTLEVSLDRRVVAAGVHARILDALTVVLISAIAAFEMFLLVIVLVTRSRGQAAVPALASARAEDVARIARPLMFGFLFAWALPLSFLPLYAGTLKPVLLGLPPSILMALPISAEMLCGLIGALLAGRLTDRRGWRSAVVLGLCVAAAGSFASAMVAHLEAFVFTRALVGLGYGLAWMGLQGLVVSRSSPVFRGRNMAWLVAGLFAGHLSGTAAGAMLADQVSYRPVFVLGGLLMLLPLLGVMLLRIRRAVPPSAAPRAGPPPAADRPVSRVPPPRGRWADLRGLLFSRDYGALLIGSVVPFSIAQVGLLYFALPLYLQNLGVAASSIGRVLMLYGLCIIYLGPVVGRIVDRSSRKKAFIALGGVLGGGGMIFLHFEHTLFAVSLAVFLLALGSCWCGAAQTSWMLSLPRVQDYGPGSATSILRAADKFGQMIGPLFVGALFTVVGIGAGLAITGLFYLCASMLFLVLAAGRPLRRTDALDE